MGAEWHKVDAPKNGNNNNNNDLNQTIFAPLLAKNCRILDFALTFGVGVGANRPLYGMGV